MNVFAQNTLLRFCGIDSFDIPTEGEAVYSEVDCPTIVFCINGVGTIFSIGMAWELKLGEAYLLQSGQIVRLLAGEVPMRGYLVRYEAYKLEREGHYIRTDDSQEGKVWIEDLQLASDACGLLLQWQSSGQGMDFGVQAQLYRLMSLLVEKQAMSREEETTEAAIARVSELIRQNPDRELTRKELARLAGLSPGYFSWAFQHYTGKSPLVYVMDIRMKLAEQHLLLGGGVKETASKVGFEDEFYFSRRFKQMTGLSPLAFVKSRSRNIASVSEPLSGSLLALRLLPAAAVFYPNHQAYKRITRLHASEEGEGVQWNQNLALLKKVGPELIFCTDKLNERAQQELSLIAPTAPIPWLSADWRQQLRVMADAMEQREEAQAWLSEYDSRVETAYRKVRRKIGGATLNIWRITDTDFRIYGQRNAGAVLYDDFRFTATHKLEEIDVFCTVPQEELKDYDADILIVMVDTTTKAAQKKAALQAAQLWTQLSAVRNGRVHEIGTDKLLEYSAWSHDRSLSFFTQMFV